MTQLFLVFTPTDLAVATELRHSLEADGYIIWHDPQYHNPQSLSFRSSIERGILGSAAIVLLWSEKASQDEWIESQFLFAQRMHRPIFLMQLDTTAFFDLSVQKHPNFSGGNSVETAGFLYLLPSFPAPHDTHLLWQLYEKAAHKYLSVRKESIAEAVVLLEQGQHREEVLAVLTYLAEHDLMMGVREKAEEALRADVAMHLVSTQALDEIFLSNTPLIESENTTTLDIVSEEEISRGDGKRQISEGKITLNPQGVHIYALPPRVQGRESLLQVVENTEYAYYLIIIPFSLHAIPGKNYYKEVKFSVELTTPGAIAFDLFPKNVTTPTEASTFYAISSNLRIEVLRAPSSQLGVPISFTTLSPQIISFGEGEQEFYWLYRGNEQRKEVSPETKYVLVVLRVPDETKEVNGMIRWEVKVCKSLQGTWRDKDCNQGFLPFRWQLGEKAPSFLARQGDRPQRGLTLFYAYAPQDQKLQSELEKHLSALRRRGWIQELHAYDVKAGRAQGEIQRFLVHSRLILLLLSADFLASDELYEQQLTLALSMQSEGKASVVPILLRPVDWQATPLAQFVVLPRNKKPIVAWSNRDDAFAIIADEIRAIIEEILQVGARSI